MEWLIIFVVFVVVRTLVTFRRQGVPWRNALGPILLLIGMTAC